ncbi:MAG: LysR substrate-binding domain-containing protein [Gammaproteobacteria bacterium]|nr:LysR substrate-binding domain-containing protein [Gammaproteobacteria bacterium]
MVDYQGFGNAAEKLGIAKSMVSRRVAELERRLGVQLLQRTTRRQSMTDAGREFYQRATQILADLNEAEQLITDAQCQVSGRIRLALPLGFGVSQLAEPIGRFLREHPDIRIDIDLNDRRVDLIEENIDLAIRIGELQDSSLIARKLARIHFVTCASPGYLQQHGEPSHPSELVEHEVLVYSNVAVGRQWFYQQDGKKISPRMKYRVSANNGEFLAAVACFGNAIVNGPLALMQRHIDSGELVSILPEYARPEVGMYALYPPGRLVSRRVRVFSDALYDHFRECSICPGVNAG